MKNFLIVRKKIKNFSKKISLSGDKSLSIRFILLASMAIGKSKAFNLSTAEDIKSAIKCLKKLGVSIKLKKHYCEVIGNGLNSYKYKNNLILNAGNSGTTARLIVSALINSPKIIKITGDNSLRRRDMKRIIEPLQEFGATFKPKRDTLPFYIKGSDFIRPISYNEIRGSAQCKSAVMIAALSAPGVSKLRCIPSRNHTELLFKHVLKVPIKIKKTKKLDYIEIQGKKNFKSFNYKIPGDISSAAFAIVLTLLSKKSELTIKDININPSRTGIISVLNMMGARIQLFNKKINKGEMTADIFVKSAKNLKAINLSKNFNNSRAIDEFLLIFIYAAFSKGISTFRGLEELNKKESKRLDWGFKILKMIGIKTKKIKNHGIKIWGQPNLKLNKNYVVKNYLKDHRVAMSTIILGLARGGNWKIHDPDSINTSFPTFNNMIKNLGGKLN
jgi:3-phosphoshikimate 1-carboxyvinyltransferase|tara:strand:+ start:1439 stop:2773 length:1335 start_codon:yes stop_codon:yes gene_type:complete